MSNIYPGVKCDIPADVYQSTFSPSWDWTTPYAGGAEIKAYWKRIVEKFNVQKYITFNSTITSAEWSKEKSKWIVHVTIDGASKTDEADFLITATGHFSQPLLPNYPGIETYRGHLRQSSNWDPDFDLAGKRVALIGNGASALQILPPLQKVVSHLDHYARNRTWIAGSFGGEDSNGLMAQDRPSEARDPEKYHGYRKALESKFFKRFRGIIKDGENNATLRKTFEKLMAERLGDRTDLLDSIIPDFSPSCQRLTPGPGYLEALTEPNVSFISSQIERFTETGIQTNDGVHREVDAII
jgi:cation diffusion facilitator CzcD-associated flavoprotein CzcO